MVKCNSFIFQLVNSKQKKKGDMEMCTLIGMW